MKYSQVHSKTVVYSSPVPKAVLVRSVDCVIDLPPEHTRRLVSLSKG